MGGLTMWGEDTNEKKSTATLVRWLRKPLVAEKRKTSTVR